MEAVKAAITEVNGTRDHRRTASRNEFLEQECQNPKALSDAIAQCELIIKYVRK